MSKLTSDEVLAALAREPEYAETPEAMKEALRPFFEALPEVLADVLDAKVDLATVLRAKCLFLRYAMDHGFVEAAINAAPVEQFGIFGKGHMTQQLVKVVNSLIARFQQFADDAVAALAKLGVDERDTLIQLGMSGETLAAYDAGTLTIADLLRQQPMVVTKNT